MGSNLGRLDYTSTVPYYLARTTGASCVVAEDRTPGYSHLNQIVQDMVAGICSEACLEHFELEDYFENVERFCHEILYLADPTLASPARSPGHSPGSVIISSPVPNIHSFSDSTSKSL